MDTIHREARQIADLWSWLEEIDGDVAVSNATAALKEAIRRADNGTREFWSNAEELFTRFIWLQHVRLSPNLLWG